jgi:L-iditol 2-dehydrogenase
MLAVRKMRPGATPFSVEEIDRPEPVAGEARVAVFGAGICGTDVHILDGDYACSPPVTIGHEVAGVVDAVGSPPDEAWIGRRVVMETAVTCGTCEWCRAGKPMLCPTRRSIGSGLDGGFASYLVVPVRNLHELPDNVDERAATVSEPLACVCNALLDPPAVNAGDRVVVIGTGAIGIIAAQVARASGGRVTLMGTASDAGRMAVASALGIECRSVDDDEQRTAMERDAAARAFRVVIECAGARSAAEWGIGLVRPGGRYVQMGLSGEASVSMTSLVLREVSVRTGMASSPTSWWRAMSLLEAWLVELGPLVTEVLPLREWPTAIDRMRKREGIKSILDPRLD